MNKQFSNGTASRKAQAMNRLWQENPNATEFEIVEGFEKIVFVFCSNLYLFISALPGIDL